MGAEASRVGDYWKPSKTVEVKKYVQQLNHKNEKGRLLQKITGRKLYKCSTIYQSEQN